MQNHSIKTGILPTHKYGIEYVEHCAVRAADDQLAFVRRKDAVQQHFNIPVGNTAVLLLGPGTSLTQQAARMCAENNVLIGFCGGGATPVYMAALNEYREPRYSRAWIAMWEQEDRRLAAAKLFQVRRSALIEKAWKKYPEITADPHLCVAHYLAQLPRCATTEMLLLEEALLSKNLYALLAKEFGREFSRKPRTKEFANAFLDAGNYLAYGLAACCLWVLGIPFSYPLVHGKTRRGALVFDVADLIKDAYVMPNAFISAALGESDSVCRRRILATLHDANALGILFKEVLALIEPAEVSPD